MNIRLVNFHQVAPSAPIMLVMMKLEKLIIFLLLVMTLSYPVCGQSVPDPDPLRFEKEISSFREWDLKNSVSDDAVLFVGSSSIRLWYTAEAFPGYPVINQDFGGSHTSDVLPYYDTLIRKYNPKLIVFYEGDNDIAADKPVKQVFDDYTELVGRIMADHPKARFLYLSIKPSTSRWSYWDKMNELNQRIKNYNSKHGKLFYTDLATPLLDSGGRPDDRYFLEDQLHLNDRGYDVWNRQLGPVLEKLLK